MLLIRQVQLKVRSFRDANVTLLKILISHSSFDGSLIYNGCSVGAHILVMS